jgi:uncharacterized protein DUF4388
MALEGTFRDFHIADIVQLIGLQRKTGTLTLEEGDETLTVIFQDGAVTWAHSARAPWERRMAHVLVARGLVTPPQIQEALNAQRSSKRKLRAILTEKGILRQEDWDSVLAREVEEAVYRPFRWTAGRYRFLSEASVDLSEGRIGPLAAEQVLMEGIRRVDEWPMILDKVPSMAMVFKVGTRVGKLNPKQVDPGEVKMLDLVDSERTAQQLVESSGLGEFEAMRSLASLVAAGAITSVGPVPAAVPTEAPATPAAARVPVRVPAVPPAWIARLAWGVVACWLLVAWVAFRMEPLGVLPLSAARAGSLDRVRSLRAQADLAELAGDVEMFAARTGEYPSSLEALRVGERPLRDPWGHPYQIRRTGSGVSLTSGGPDGRFGTPDDLTVGDRGLGGTTRD